MTTRANTSTLAEPAHETVLRFPRVEHEDDTDEIPWRRDEAWWDRRDAQMRAEREADARRLREAERHARAALLRRAGFPERAIDAALAPSPLDPPALKLAREYAASGARTALVLAGGTGTGKTTAATWTGLSASSGDAPVFLRAAELEARGRHDRGLRARLRSCSLLVLDDLGAEVLDARGVFRSLFDEVVDALYADRRRLVITTNLLHRRRGIDEEPQFVERYGERAASRLREVGLWGDCGNDDLRGAPGGA